MLCFSEVDTKPCLMKHYRAKPSAQLPKHMHSSYKLVDNHLDIVPVIKAVHESHGHHTAAAPRPMT